LIVHLNRFLYDNLASLYSVRCSAKYWGDGKHAGVDGTQWDVYENNLLSERHIRYGGYGGIAYYHVSDTYIG
jgi:TnpA family transposase